MKQAVIAIGGNQYLVAEGETLDVDHIKDEAKTVKLTPLLVIDEGKATIGKPEVTGAVVTAEVTEPLVKADKVTAIRYKAKKRVKKVHGHRQHQTRLTIKKIA